MGANRYFYVLLATSIVTLAGLTQLFIKTFPLLYANAIRFCQKTLSNISITLPSSFQITIIGMILFIFLIGVIAISIQTLKTRRYIAKNLSKKIIISRKLRAIFKSLHLENRVDVVRDDSLLSFGYGLFIPRICVSTGLIQSLTAQELKAVLLHERYHLKNHDPLRILLGKTASLMLFFIPILKDIQAHYAISSEIAADEVVIRKGDKHSLIFALKKLLFATVSNLSGVAAFTDSHSLENRILYLI